jgi:divalent metal cation (Fe/Co/Zn/Cd) transporter
VVASLHALADADPEISEVRRVLTMVFGPDDVLLNLELRFDAALSVAQRADAQRRLESAIRTRHPSIKRIFIETLPTAPASGS